MNVLLMTTRPSDPEDPRFLLPRSPECPNGAPADIVAKGIAGTCGTCAWGFYTMESKVHGEGEIAAGLALEPALDQSGQQLGYKSRCGKVTIFRDKEGRIGALKKIEGEERFFPALNGNWAAERYFANHPELAAVAS